MQFYALFSNLHKHTHTQNDDADVMELDKLKSHEDMSRDVIDLTDRLEDSLKHLKSQNKYHGKLSAVRNFAQQSFGIN